ncbi:colicin V production protein [Sulfuricaulis limicola]|uniref:Colicin V production protein n=1 Tax=Sulfuricaulis limicola TaxID=1620215 RepID=A0A1B4XDL8_9GAMM|nr:CvpA family protein [Sulfuricaulis limicola]BAV32906.1 colicin V production protein [Sulfuricaulis limicola]
MNGFDLLILATLALFVALGAWRGLLSEAISLLTWVLACVLAWFYAAPLSRLLRGLVQDEALRQLSAFVLIFAVVFVLGVVASWLLHKYFPLRRGFRLANTVLGGLVGAARGAVVVVVVFLVAGLTPFPQRDWWRESAMAPVFERAALYVAGYIPRDIAQHIRYG